MNVLRGESFGCEKNKWSQECSGVTTCHNLGKGGVDYGKLLKEHITSLDHYISMFWTVA